jgi:hypothetical protein
MFYNAFADCSFTTRLKDINVVHIGSDVTLSCCLDKEHRVQWYKDQRFAYSSVQYALTICITGRVSYKKKAGTHYPSRAPVFTVLSFISV